MSILARTAPGTMMQTVAILDVKELKVRTLLLISGSAMKWQKSTQTALK